MKQDELMNEVWAWLQMMARWLIPRLAVVFIGAVGVHGVYVVSTWFMSPLWSQIAAGSLVSVYVGLALHPMSPQLYNHARHVSWVAVITETVNIFVSGVVHLAETKPHWALEARIIVSIVQAMPMPYLGFAMSNLVLHPSGGFITSPKQRGESWLNRFMKRRKTIDNTTPSNQVQPNLKNYPEPTKISPDETLSKTTTKPQKRYQIKGGRKQSITNDDVLAALDNTTTRKGLINILGVSGATVDRRLKDLIDAGLIKGDGRGNYHKV